MATLLILTDIWGDVGQLTQWLTPLVSQSEWAGDIEVLSPYSKLATDFVSEREAYECFVNRGGLDAYIDKVQAVLDEKADEHTWLLGFSAGGAAAFALATRDKAPYRVFAVYGGQIHRLPNKQVHCPCLLLFSDESHFSVPSLINELTQQPLVRAEHWAVPHGFANPRSPGFVQSSAKQLGQLIVDWLNG